MTILERHGRRVAALVYDAGLDEDPALLDAVSSAAGLALENERLLAELRAQLDEIRHSRTRIVDAADSERRRLERNLHDGAQQRLVTLALHLRIAQESLHDDPATAEQMLDGVGEDLKLALSELRDLARGLHPAILTDRGLAPALQALANRAPFPVEITGVPTVRPNRQSKPPSTTSSQKASPTPPNTPTQPKRTSTSSTAGDAITVEIRDNGTGGASLSSGSGLRGLADRIEALNGTIEIESTPESAPSSEPSCLNRDRRPLPRRSNGPLDTTSQSRATLRGPRGALHSGSRTTHTRYRHRCGGPTPEAWQPCQGNAQWPAWVVSQRGNRR